MHWRVGWVGGCVCGVPAQPVKHWGAGFGHIVKEQVQLECVRSSFSENTHTYVTTQIPVWQRPSTHMHFPMVCRWHERHTFYSHTNTIQSKTLELISWIQVLPQASNDWIRFFFLKHAWKQCSASLNAHNAQQWKYKTCASIYKRQNQFILVHTSYLAKPSKTNWDQIFACLNLNSWWGKVDTVRRTSNWEDKRTDRRVITESRRIRGVVHVIPKKSENSRNEDTQKAQSCSPAVSFS